MGPDGDTMRSEDDSLTLHEAAERAGVHYMTVYRWVRTSRLPAVKRDGRWVVAGADVQRMAEGGSVPADTPTGEDRATGAPRASVVERLQDRLVTGDVAGAGRVVEEAMAGGLDAEAVHLDLLPAAMRKIGERWAAGELSIADEHRASAATTGLLGSLSHHFHRRGRRRGTIVIGAPAGDHHALPTAMLADPARGRGFDVIDLGADLPPAAFAEAAARVDRLVCVGIHASVRSDTAIAETVTALREALGAVPVLVGGTGIDDADHARRLGADRHADSPASALDGLTERG